MLRDGNAFPIELLEDEAYVDEDEKKSMAIVNLQAMLNIEDVDRVIELL